MTARPLVAAVHAAADWAQLTAHNHADAAATSRDALPRLRLFEPARRTLSLGRRLHRLSADDRAPWDAAAAAIGATTTLDDRGGQATLHLPGQLVVLVAIATSREAVPTLIGRWLAAMGAVATAVVGRPIEVVSAGDTAGLWLDGAKLASVGVRWQQGVMRHGLALNVAIDTDLPPTLPLCGRCGSGYASLAAPGALSPLALAPAAVEATARAFATPPAPTMIS